MCVQKDADALDLALDLTRFYGPATDDARPAGSSPRGGDAVNGGRRATSKSLLRPQEAAEGREGHDRDREAAETRTHDAVADFEVGHGGRA